MSTSKHRTVIQEPSFTDAFNQLRISYQRLDEVLSGVHSILVVHPELCPLIEGTVLSMIKTLEFPHVPPLRIFFTYTDDEVHLRHVEVIEDGAGEV